MKIWNIPSVEELDVMLTAKGPGDVEMNAGGGEGDWTITATYNSATHEWNEAGNGGAGCLEEKKDS